MLLPSPAKALTRWTQESEVPNQATLRFASL
jgi:hypothetical protein